MQNDEGETAAMQQDKASDADVEMCSSETSKNNDIGKVDPDALEKSYREALAAFKKDKSNKNRRRAKTSAKKAWDEAIKATQDGEPLNCRDCSLMFMFSEKDQKFYLDNGWMHRPTRCKKCSETSKERLENRTNRDSKVKNMCYAFQRGECGYGDQCKFSHDPNGKGKSDNRGDSASGDKLKKNKEITFIAQCKWGSECTLKKCRFSHDSSVEIKAAKVKPTKEAETGPSSKSGMRSKNSKEQKSVVKKAMRKALKKAPSKQLKIKELRKAVKTGMGEKSRLMSKTELKDAISDALVQSKNKFNVEGKMIQLIV
jgi:hypothetical protein